MPKLSDLKPLSNHELISHIKSRSASPSDAAGALELGLLKVELAGRAKPIKNPFSSASARSAARDLSGDDLKAYETDVILRLNASDAKVLAGDMLRLSSTDQFKVQRAIFGAFSFEEAKHLMHVHRSRDWRLKAKIQIQNLLIFALIVAAVLLYKQYKAGF
ncbi:MAG: hypothetical protein EOP04_11130 [Proteobacteria bacterium]|nr:MAG: hypothetical protein EOP04_11130 [Pseudomonadota bacterium]